MLRDRFSHRSHISSNDCSCRTHAVRFPVIENVAGPHHTRPDRMMAYTYGPALNTEQSTMLTRGSLPDLYCTLWLIRFSDQGSSWEISSEHVSFMRQAKWLAVRNRESTHREAILCAVCVCVCPVTEGSAGISGPSEPRLAAPPITQSRFDSKVERGQ